MHSIVACIVYHPLSLQAWYDVPMLWKLAMNVIHALSKFCVFYSDHVLYFTPRQHCMVEIEYSF